MRLIELTITAFCVILGFGALFVGNFVEGTILWLLPLGYFAVTKARAMRAQRKAELEKIRQEAEEYSRKRRAMDEAESEQYHRHRAMQLQQMNMMHQNSIQNAAQQQAAMNRQGWSDPRASYGNDLADNIINLWAINSMLNQPSAVHAATVSPSGPAVTDTPPSRVDPIQFHSFVNSGSESTSSSSSSSSYSSDTSSDSFGGSDTSSDSF
jgi:uncharacterized membrane protein